MTLSKLVAATLLAGMPWLACAESLRCAGGIVAEGDSRISVIYKCGPPLLADSYCSPAYSPGSIYPVPEPFASTVVPCLRIEAWLYERGPGELVATVYLRSGVVQSIAYGQPR